MTWRCLRRPFGCRPRGRDASIAMPSRTAPAEGPSPPSLPSPPPWLVGIRRAQSASGRSLRAVVEVELYPLVIIYYARCCSRPLEHEKSDASAIASCWPFVIILCQTHVGTLVAQRTTGHTCHVIKSSSSAYLVLVSFVVFATLTIVASRCYASSSSDTVDRSQYHHQRPQSRIIVRSSSAFVSPPKSHPTSSLVLSRSAINISDTAGVILTKKRRIRSKREYLAAFDNLLEFYREESAKRDERRLSEKTEDGGKAEEEATTSAAHRSSNNNNNKDGASVVADREDASASIADADGTDDVNVYAELPAPPPPVNKGFPFESSTQRSMPPAHVSGNSRK